MKNTTPTKVELLQQIALLAAAIGTKEWEPYLHNLADGVDGHYCIARHNPRGYTEFLNGGKWCSVGEVIDIPDHRKTVVRPLAARPAQGAQNPNAEMVADLKGIRQRAIDKGMPLLSIDEVNQEQGAQNAAGQEVRLDRRQVAQPARGDSTAVRAEVLPVPAATTQEEN